MDIDIDISQDNSQKLLNYVLWYGFYVSNMDNSKNDIKISAVK